MILHNCFIQNYFKHSFVAVTCSFCFLYVNFIKSTTSNLFFEGTFGGGFLVQRSIRGRAAEMGCKISHLDVLVHV